MKTIDYKDLELKALDFCDWLQKNHTGLKNSITYKEMGNKWGDHRSVRHIVHYLRKNGFPICSGHTGYYYASSKEEVEGVMKYLMSFMSNYQQAYDGLNKSLKDL